MPIVDPQTGQMDLRYQSNDQDYFIPVSERTKPIDTLPGASNLNQIADIRYTKKFIYGT
jgi:hypothetical protein